MLSQGDTLRRVVRAHSPPQVPHQPPETKLPTIISEVGAFFMPYPLPFGSGYLFRPQTQGSKAFTSCGLIDKAFSETQRSDPLPQGWGTECTKQTGHQGRRGICQRDEKSRHTKADGNGSLKCDSRQKFWGCWRER